MKISTRLLIIILAISTLTNAQAQSETLTLEQCYEMARQNYPQIKQLELIQQSTDYSVDNVKKHYLPQINLKGQATYQSDVTSVPISIPGQTIESPPKDQYKIYGEINQPITDLITLKKQKELVELNGSMSVQKLEVDLYKIKERINQLYFGILMLNAQLELTDVLEKELDSSMIRLKSAIANGVSLPSAGALLEIEQIKVDQKVIELKASKSTYLEMLGTFLNKDLGEQTELSLPLSISTSNEMRRPELTLFEQQKNQLSLHNDLISAKNLPSLGFFFQGGYGQPGLNFLSNQWDTYYVTGLRLNWSISGLYTMKKERKIITINQSMIAAQQETFEFKINLLLNQQKRELTRIEQLITQDEKIIQLHEQVTKVATTQLENGTITTLDYVSNLNALDQARLTKINHEIQMLMAQQKIQITTGN